ncbi:MAG: carbohydrate ABC transporter permease [Alphaproteobacteria bacterium]
MLHSRFYKHLFLWPAVIALLAIIIFPLVYTVLLSFSGWSVNRPGLDSVGWANYARALGDARFWDSLSTLYTMVGLCVAFEYVLGFGLALLLWKQARAGRFFRVLFIVPMCVTPVIMAVVWRTIFHETLGPMNDVLGWFGIPAVNWLSQTAPAFAAVIIIDVWQWTSFIFILMLAGLMSLPHEPFEAAQIDGAGPIRTFIHVTFPLMAPITLGALVIRLIEASKLMDTIYALTSGGPGSSTETTSYMLYIRGLREFQIGYTASMSIVYLLIMLVGLTVIAKLLTKAMGIAQASR